MKALVKFAAKPKHVEVQELPLPMPDPGEVRIAVKAAAVCGSDITAYMYPPNYHGFVNIPVTLGHEVSGIIDSIGKDVDTFDTGERVLIESNRYCGKCSHCLSGYTTSCKNAEIAGLHFNGGMAEYMCIPAKLLHRLPQGLSFQHGTIAQPLSVVLHGMIDRIKFPVGETVLIFGPGVLGILAAQVASILGGARIIVAGIDTDEKHRLPVARALGYETLISSELQGINPQNDFPGKISLIIDCSGGHGVPAASIELLDKRGQLLILGIPKKLQELDVSRIVRNEITICGSYTGAWSNYEQALTLINNGKINVTQLIREYPIENSIQGFEDALAGKVLKPIIIP